MRNLVAVPIMTLAVLTLAACAPERGPRDPGRLRPAANPGQVIATERAFARMAVEKGTSTAFRYYATKDAQFPPPPTWTNVQQSLKGTPDAAKPIIWGPDAAWSSCDGSFAVTTGEAAFPNGRKSRFLTVWQRQNDGEYRWVLDQGFASPGGDTSPEVIPARVAECPKGPRPDPLARRSATWGSGKANDGSLAWETTLTPDCTRTAVVRMASADGMQEVFRKTEPPATPPAGQPAPRCPG